MIEDLARAAAEDVRSTSTIDLETGLREVFAAHRRHRRRAASMVAAAVVLALGVGWWGGLAMNKGASTPQPAHHGSGGHAAPVTCAPGVRCLGSSRYRYELTRPVLWRQVPGYQANSGGGVTPWSVESYARGRGPATGVTVLEGVRVPTPDGLSVQSGVPDAPHAFVAWLASRPYLAASPVEHTSIDGRAAWRVRVTLRDGAGQGPAMCNAGYACHVITRTPDGGTAGIADTMTADYTAFRLHGAGTTVVWSWTFSPDLRLLANNRAVVAGISWPNG